MPREPSPPLSTPLLEVRSYRLTPGARDSFIALFEDEIFDAYEASGAAILGTFRDPDDPDHWLWIRAFPDAEARGAALAAFYGGKTWARVRPACRAAIQDSRNGRVMQVQAGAWPSPAGDKPDKGAFECLCVFPKKAQQDALAQSLANADGEAPQAPLMALLASSSAPNAYPVQALRTGACLMRWARFESSEALQAWREAQSQDPAFQDHHAELNAGSARPPRRLRLLPTARSVLC